MDGTKKKKRPVKTIVRSIRILEFIKENDCVGLSEIAEELPLAKSTIHRHLGTLEDEEFILKQNGKYSISLEFLRYGDHARTRIKGYELIKSKVDFLAEETEERAQFTVEEFGHGIYLYRSVGKNAIRTDPGLGDRFPLHATAAGKITLAHLPDKKVEQILDTHGLQSYTANTITDHEVLFEMLERYLEQGYSTTDEEYYEGVRAIAVPIRVDDRLVGALSIAGPSHRMKGELLDKTIRDLLLGSANELELNIPQQ